MDDFKNTATVGLPVDALFYVIKHRKEFELEKFGCHMKEKAAKKATAIVVGNLTEYVGSKIFKDRTFQQRLGIKMVAQLTSHVAGDLVYRDPTLSTKALIGTAVATSLIEGVQFVFTEKGGEEWLLSKGCTTGAHVVHEMREKLGKE